MYFWIQGRVFLHQLVPHDSAMYRTTVKPHLCPTTLKPRALVNILKCAFLYNPVFISEHLFGGSPYSCSETQNEFVDKYSLAFSLSVLIGSHELPSVPIRSESRLMAQYL